MTTSLNHQSSASAQAPSRGPGEREEAQSAPTRVALALDIATILLLPAMMIYLGLNAGGYFADTTGWAAVAVAVALALRTAASGVPLARAGWAAALAAGALALFALWTLLSAVWFASLGHALLEFDRVLLYVLVLVLFASLEQPRAALRWLPAGFAIAAVFLCAVGLATRTLPDLWPFAPTATDEALAYPVTYSNGLGLLTSLGIIACLHLASWDRERALIRVLAIAALPLLAATLALTDSTGAEVAGGAGVVVYALLGRPRGLVAALLAATPFVLLAYQAGQGAELLERADPTTPAAIDQGRELARTVGLTMLAAAGLLALLLVPERWLIARVATPSRRVAAVIAAALVLPIAVIAVTQLPDALRAVGDEIEGVGPRGGPVDPEQPESTGAFAALKSQSRIDYWRVALDAFEEEPLKGAGVGSFAKRWAMDRPMYDSATVAHSLYIGTLAELGLVGMALLAICLATILLAFAVRMRGDQRPLLAAALGLAAAWLIHAGLDWDWELPVLTVWLFAFGGCALAAWGRSSRRRGISPALRAGAAVACLAIAITPATIALSQSRLDGSVSALLRGDCVEAERLAASASTLVPPRAEPYELLAYCASRRGDHQRASAMMRRALDRDPASWDLVYGLALVRAAGGEDPRPTLERAHRLNPRQVLVIEARKRFVGEDPRRWRRQADVSPLPLP